MKENSLKTRSEILQSTKKHKFKIVQDYDRYEIFYYSGLILFITALILMVILFSKNQTTLAGIVSLAAFFVGIMFFIISSRCPICDSFRWYRRIEYKVFESEKLFCEKCNLIDKQMSKYVDMLKRGVEINEENVRRIFMEK